MGGQRFAQPIDGQEHQIGGAQQRLQQRSVGVLDDREERVEMVEHVERAVRRAVAERYAGGCWILVVSTNELVICIYGWARFAHTFEQIRQFARIVNLLDEIVVAVRVEQLGAVVRNYELEIHARTGSEVDWEFG